MAELTWFSDPDDLNKRKNLGWAVHVARSRVSALARSNYNARMAGHIPVLPDDKDFEHFVELATEFLKNRDHQFDENYRMYRNVLLDYDGEGHHINVDRVPENYEYRAAALDEPYLHIRYYERTSDETDSVQQPRV